MFKRRGYLLCQTVMLAGIVRCSVEKKLIQLPRPRDTPTDLLGSLLGEQCTRRIQPFSGFCDPMFQLLYGWALRGVRLGTPVPIV